MKISKLSCLYYPTTVVLIDDDPSFLKSIAFRLDPNMSYKTYLDPREALDYLKNLKSQNKLFSHSVALNPETENYIENQFSVQFNLSKIYQEVYNPNIFNEVSIIIADYAMPNMNGADLFRNLADVPIKKMMLTGQADESSAVDLFNEGLIDKFILKKNTQTLKDLINQSIQELQYKYFQDLSEVIFKSLSLQPYACFDDPDFIDFFYKIKNDISASSYYMLEPSGSFLFFDENARPTWLLVKTKEEMIEFAKQASAEGAPDEVAHAIEQGTKIIHFNNFDEYTHATEGHWEDYLYSAQKLNGKKEYRYAIVNSLPGFPLEQDKIQSFSKYLHSDSTQQE